MHVDRAVRQNAHIAQPMHRDTPRTPRHSDSSHHTKYRPPGRSARSPPGQSHATRPPKPPSPAVGARKPVPFHHAPAATPPTAPTRPHRHAAHPPHRPARPRSPRTRPAPCRAPPSLRHVLPRATPPRPHFTHTPRRVDGPAPAGPPSAPPVLLPPVLFSSSSPLTPSRAARLLRAQSSDFLLRVLPLLAASSAAAAAAPSSVARPCAAYAFSKAARLSRAARLHSLSSSGE